MTWFLRSFLGLVSSYWILNTEYWILNGSNLSKYSIVWQTNYNETCTNLWFSEINLSCFQFLKFPQSHSLFNCMSGLLYEKPRLLICKSRITSLLCLKPSIDYRHIGNKSKFLNVAHESPWLSICLPLPLGHDPQPRLSSSIQVGPASSCLGLGCSAANVPAPLSSGLGVNSASSLQQGLAPLSKVHSPPTCFLQSSLHLYVLLIHSLKQKDRLRVYLSSCLDRSGSVLVSCTPDAFRTRLEVTVGGTPALGPGAEEQSFSNWAGPDQPWRVHRQLPSRARSPVLPPRLCQCPRGRGSTELFLGAHGRSQRPSNECAHNTGNNGNGARSPLKCRTFSVWSPLSHSSACPFRPPPLGPLPPRCSRPRYFPLRPRFPRSSVAGLPTKQDTG